MIKKQRNVKRHRSESTFETHSLSCVKRSEINILGNDGAGVQLVVK